MKTSLCTMALLEQPTTQHADPCISLSCSFLSLTVSLLSRTETVLFLKSSSYSHFTLVRSPPVLFSSDSFSPAVSRSTTHVSSRASILGNSVSFCNCLVQFQRTKASSSAPSSRMSMVKTVQQRSSRIEICIVFSV